MKITIVCDVLGEANNGTTIAALNLIGSLRQKGHDVTVLCPDADKAGLPGYVVTPVYHLGPFDGYVKRNGVVLAKADDRIIRRAIDGADIVHVMVPFALGRRAAQLARQAGIPVSAGFHAMAENFTVHVFLKNSRLANRLTYRYYSGLYRNCDAIHYPTQFLRDLYERLYGRTNGYVISNGVCDCFRPAPAEKPAQFQGKFVVVFTGRYSREKSHAVLIDAVARSAFRDKIQLVFAGEGPEKEALKRRAEKLPLRPVFSFFSRAEMVQLLNYADLYVHPAEIEAEGIGCLEAIACGLVPLISDSPRCATGAYAPDARCLFHYRDPGDLARKLDALLEDPALRASLRARCLAEAQEQFRLGACMDRMERMLLDTAARRGAPPQ